MRSSTAAGITIFIVVALVAVLLLNGVPVTCDPPRHMVHVDTLDGFGRSECVQTVTLPDGRLATVQPTVSPSPAYRR